YTTTYSGSVITALTDATGCPGVWCGRDGEAAGLLNCCATGTTNCSGTCKTTGTYTTNDGACTGSCNTAYVQLRNQCGEVVNPKFDTYQDAACGSDILACECLACKERCVSLQYTYWWVRTYASDPYHQCFCFNHKGGSGYYLQHNIIDGSVELPGHDAYGSHILHNNGC
ncbi:MAG: hypothetical protein LBF81_07565, partial [Prevotellaceae bacterium]|nr:hypothetical protein [Prevotellaceae bacterium]